MAENDFLTGYLSGQNENRNGNGMLGGGWEGLLGLIVILAVLGGGFGFGGFGGGFGGGAGLQGMATRADINAGFAFNDLQNGIRGITNGLSDTTYALNNTITSGFHSVDRGFCDLSHQLSQCCCDNRAAIADLKYTIANEDCATRNLIQNTTRDVIDSQNAGTRAILDFLTQDKIATLTAENQSLKFAASQANQNAFITANQEAQTATLLRRLGADCPTPAYLVQPPTPVNFPTNGCGTVQFGNWGNGWGCGCGFAA